MEAFKYISKFFLDLNSHFPTVLLWHTRAVKDALTPLKKIQSSVSDSGVLILCNVKNRRKKESNLLWLCRKVGSSKNSSFNFHIIMGIQTLTNAVMCILPFWNNRCHAAQHPTDTDQETEQAQWLWSSVRCNQREAQKYWLKVLIFI